MKSLKTFKNKLMNLSKRGNKNYSKKAITIMLLLSMTISNVIAVEKVEEEATFQPEILISEDFESYDDGSTYTGKALQTPNYYGYHYHKVETDDDMKSKAMRMINLGYKENGEWTSSAAVKLSGVNYDGDLVMEQKFKTTGNVRNFIFRVQDISGNLVQTFKSQDGFIMAIDGTQEVRAFAYENGSSIDIRMILHTDNDPSTQDTFDLYVDGTLIHEGYKLQTNLNGNVAMIELAELSFNTGMQETIMDDFKVYRANEEVIQYLKDNQPVYIGENQLEYVGERSTYIDKTTGRVFNNNEWFDKYNVEFKAGENYLPLKLLSDLYWAPIDWDDYNKTAFIDYKQRRVYLQMNSNVVIENGVSTTLAEPIISHNGETYVPLSFLNYLDRSTEVLYDRYLVLSEYSNEEIKKISKELLDELFSEYQKLTYYVAIDGSNDNDGTIEKPFADIYKAQSVIREKIAEGYLGDIDVIFRKGLYSLVDTVTFNHLDSLPNGYKITYKNYDGEEVVFTKGKEVTGWVPYKDGIYKASLPEKTEFGILTENGEVSEVSRYPDNDVLNMIREPSAEKTSFRFNPGDIPQIKDIKSVEINLWPGGPDGYWAWWNYNSSVSKIDYASNRVDFPGAQWSYVLGTGTRYNMRNALEILNRKGEYYVDKTAREVYYMPKNLPIEDQTIVIPVKGMMLKFVGKNEQALAKNITIEGIDMTGVSSTTEAIKISNARNITIKDSKLHATGSNGINITGFARNNTITGCHIYDIGNNGITLGNVSETELINFGNVMYNNYIHHVGRVIGSGAGVSITAGENIVSHNRIHTSNRYAISLKGTQKNSIIGRTINGVEVTKENTSDFRFTEKNIIEYNDISHANIESQDSGIFECFGTDIGNILRNNNMHDSDYNFSLGVGLYLDDGNDEWWVYNNLVTDLQNNGRGELDGVVYLKGARNVFENNILANNNTQDGFIQTNMMGEPNNSLVIRSNIMTNSGDYIYKHANWETNRISISDYNLYYNKKGVYNMLGGASPAENLDEWKKIYNGKFDNNSVIADPKFVDSNNRDYRVKYDSPAYEVGFRDINMEDIGVTKDFKYAVDGEMDKLFVRASNQRVNSSFANVGIGSSVNLLVNARAKTSGYFIDMSKASVTYKSSNPEIATVDATGKVTGISKGVSNIKITVVKDSKTLETEIDILVGDTVTTVEPKISQTTLSEKDKSEFKVFGKTAFNHSYEVNLGKIDITSSDDSVLKVNENKTLLATVPGQSKLSVKDSVTGIQNEYNFTVLESPIDIVSIKNEGKYLKIGESQEITVTATKLNTDPANLEGRTITYTVDDPEIADVVANGDKATLTMKKDGIVKVTAQIGEGDNVASAYTYITALPEEVNLSSGWDFLSSKDADGYVSFRDNTIDFSTNGVNIWGEEDDYSFLYKETDTDNSEISVKINSIQDIGSFDTAVGPMYRAHLGDNSYFIMVRILPSGAVRVVYRNEAKPTCGFTSPADMTFPAELKIARKGNNFQVFCKNNDEWNMVFQQDVEMGSDGIAYAGVAGMAAYNRAATVMNISDLELTEK